MKFATIIIILLDENCVNMLKLLCKKILLKFHISNKMLNEYNNTNID